MGVMWEFLEWVGVRRSVVLLIVIVSVCGGVGGDERRGRLVVVRPRQFGDGVGEVVRVDPEEYERLVNEEGVRVVKGAVVNGANSSRLSSDNETVIGISEVRDAGVPDVESLVGGGQGSNVSESEVSTTEVVSLSSTTGSTTSMNPVVVAVNPEDSSRGTGQQVEHNVRFVPGIDRRKVQGKPEGGGGSGGGGGGQDLSFTGILNGLLDSFINDPPPRSQSPRPSQSPNPTPSSPSSEDTSVLEDDEEEEELEEEPPRSKPPSKPSIQSPPSTTEDISNEQENVSEEPIEDDEEILDDYSPSDNSTINRPPHTPKGCQGECRNILFGLFLCDEIDNDAFCPESGHTCCVNNPEPEYTRYKPYGNSSSEESTVDMGEKVPTITTQESNEDPVEEEEFDEDESPQQQTQSSSEDNRKKPSPPQQRPPPQNQPPPRYPTYNNRPMYNPQNPPHQYYYPPPPKTHNNPPMLMHQPPPRMPLPCPRYCVKNFLDNYCSERLPSQFACGVDGFCCAHDVPMDTIKDNQQADEEEEDERDEQLRNEGLGQGEVDVDEEKSSNKVIGPCTEEVGSCVSTNIINIICFAHATPTDMYTCPRSSMKCCARKTALPKDSLPSTTTPPPKENSITRNASSSNYPPRPHPQDQPPQGPQILPQFAPPHPHAPPPPPPHQYVPNTPFHPPPPQMAPPTHSPTPPPLAETPPPPLGGIPGTQITNQFSTNSLGGGGRIPPRQPVGQYVCGVKGVPTVAKRRRRKRVVGGSDSLPGEWCWQVALINSLNQYLCGGALIGTQWVLTAAHCVTNIVRSGDAIYVRVGDHDLTSRYGSPGAQTLRVATTYIHHNHNSQTLDNDIALLKLQGNAALKEGVCLVCLPSRNHMSEIPGKRCTVTGYGYMGESGPIPLRIREANLPIVSDDECVRKVNSVTEKVFALPMSSFCAGGDKSGHDACQGDGGGPLVCRADDPTTGDTGSGYYELTGLVSWGFGCGRENVPGVYVKVSSFIGWIHQIIRSN